MRSSASSYQNEKEGLTESFEIAQGIEIPAGNYSFGSVTVGLDTGAHRPFVTSLSYGTGDFYGGRRDTIGAEVEWTPIPRFRAMAGYQYNDIELPQGSFIRRLARFGLDVIFSSKLSWVNLLQYDNDSEIVGINSRLHWIPQAGREMFLVLNHNLEDFDRDNNFRSSFADVSLQYRYTFRF